MGRTVGAFPPRLPEQPIFYPVLNQEYAVEIGRDWNAPSAHRAGFVTRFEVEQPYVSRFEFVETPRERIWGFRDEWVTSTDHAPISDLERAILDGCFRPDLCGGMSEVGRALWMARQKLDFVRLVDYVRRYGKVVIAKRTGYLLDVYQLGQESTREAVHEVAARSPATACWIRSCRRKAPAIRAGACA